jgi:chromosome partitioning protein
VVEKMAIVSFAIQKGGTGKTTSAVMISALLARKNRRVLLIDMDPQASATECLVDPTEIQDSPCIGDVLLKDLEMEDAIQRCDYLKRLNFLPSKPSMLIQEYWGRYSNIFEDTLKIELGPVEGDYDYIILDCPPNLLHFTKNALWASEYVINTLEPEPLAYEGLNQFIISILPDIRLHNSKLKPGGGIIINRAQATRVYLPKEIKSRITGNPYMGQGFLFRTEVHLDQDLAKMPLHRKPASEYSSSQGVSDYAALTVEFESRIPP